MLTAWILVGVAAMLTISLAHHLGLIQKAYEICEEIAECSTCSVFWGTLLVLLLCRCHLGIAAALALILAYMSNWIALIYDLLNKWYGKLWKRRKK